MLANSTSTQVDSEADNHEPAVPQRINVVSGIAASLLLTALPGATVSVPEYSVMFRTANVRTQQRIVGADEIKSTFQPKTAATSDDDGNSRLIDSIIAKRANAFIDDECMQVADDAVDDAIVLVRMSEPRRQSHCEFF